MRPIYKKILAISISSVLAILLIIFTQPFSITKPSVSDIRTIARCASVQTVFHIPAMKVAFTEPLPKDKKFTEETFKKLIAEKEKEIEKQIGEAIKKAGEPKHETYLTNLEVWGYQSLTKTFVPLGAIAPKDVKFPARVLVTCKVEKEEISPWEKEYEEDVLTISETANVSPTQAQTILQNLIIKGYSISKEEIKKSEEIELLYFSSWDTTYPTRLSWKVTIEGEENNIIIGYDPRGILEVRPIPDGKRVNVKAGYFDLLDDYKEKSAEIKALEEKLEKAKEDIEEAQKKIDEMRKEYEDISETKRDISTVTWADVKWGTVQLEYFYFMSPASGVFLGNMNLNKENKVWQGYRPWGSYTTTSLGKDAGVILTNAHVANQAMSFEIYVSEDLETMWIIYPGVPSIRYTKDSDHYGTPASVLSIDQEPVMSWDYDCAVMVTSVVPQYEKFKAYLGNSDNVTEGDPVITVGNPSSMQKFTSKGIISNTEYSALDRLDSNYLLKYLTYSKPFYNWIKNSCFWVDTTIGVGGTSGSGTWAEQGSEAGKVIALRNMGMTTMMYDMVAVLNPKKKKDCKDGGFCPIDEPKPIKETAKEYGCKLFENFSWKTAQYTESFKGFIENEPLLKKHCGGKQDIAGMNGCIPINRIKTFLQERGLDPEHFEWDGIKGEYWER